MLSPDFKLVGETIDALYRAYKAGERLDCSTLDAGLSVFVLPGLVERVQEDAKRSLLEAFGFSMADLEATPERPSPLRTKFRNPRPPGKRRKQALEALGGKCQKCGHDGSEHVLCFHHIEGTIPGGRQRKESIWLEAILNPERFALLCEPCHLAAHGGYYSKGHHGRVKVNGKA